MITVPYKFTPREYQLELFKALDGIEGKPKTKFRRAILRWHRRAGKDLSCFCYMAKEAYQNPGNYFYIFPTSADARKALWENIDALTGLKVIDQIPASLMKLNNQEMKIEMQTSEPGKVSTIRIVGYDTNPDSLRGIACKGAVVSEAAFSHPDVLKVLMPSLMQAKGFLILNSTPNGRNHYYKLWENVKDDPEWFVSELQTYWPDRPNYSGLVSREEIDQLVRSGIEDQEDVEREFGVSFDTGLKGSIYGYQVDKAREEDRICTVTLDSGKPVNTLFDIGQNDVTAVWFFQEDGSNLNFIDFWEDSRLGTNGIVKELKERGYEYGYHVFPHDADHKKQGKELTSFRESFEESQADFGVDGECIVLDRTADRNKSIKEVRKRFTLYRFDSIKCAKGIDHLSLYSREFNKRTRTFSTSPKHDEHSNAADALRMEAESVNSRVGHSRIDYASFNVDDYNYWD